MYAARDQVTRLHCRTRPSNVSCIRPCTGVFGRVGWPCTLPFSAVYIARTRPCTRPSHGRVQGPSGPCIRQVGLPGCVHVLRRHATAVCVTLRHTVRVHCPCRRTCTRLCMGRVHDCVLAVYTDVYMARTRPFNCGVDVCTCRTAV